jgi:hypothetical protein
VHTWYEARFGTAVDPLTSVEDAVGTWPETATAVAVRLRSNDELQVIAPCGLSDLFAMLLRRNPRRASRELFRRRAADKRITERWPRVPSSIADLGVGRKREPGDGRRMS